MQNEMDSLHVRISELENVNKMLRQEIYHKELKHLDDIQHCHARISELEAQIKQLLTECGK